MGGILGSKPKSPKPPPPPPVDNSAAVEAAKRDELARRKAQGRASTILTNMQDSESATTSSAKLLGG